MFGSIRPVHYNLIIYAHCTYLDTLQSCYLMVAFAKSIVWCWWNPICKYSKMLKNKIKKAKLIAEATYNCWIKIVTPKVKVVWCPNGLNRRHFRRKDSFLKCCLSLGHQTASTSILDGKITKHWSKGSVNFHTAI